MSTKHKKTSGSTLLRRIILSLLVIAIAVIGFLVLLHGKDIAVLNPKGVIGQQQKQLIIFTVGLGMTVVIPVFIMVFAFAWRYREGNNKAKYTPEVGGNRVLELIWWGIPIVIIAILGAVAWKTSHSLDPYRHLESSRKPLTIQVVSLQWKWLFIYPSQSTVSVNELRIPENTPVNFELTADSPMNGFWIPKLGSQVYAMNGMTSKLSLEATEKGTYRGVSSNISGEGYADMKFDVVVTSQGDFDSWVNSIMTDEDHDDIDWSAYQELAKPSVIPKPRYYMLHEANLFNLILGKYMDMPDVKPEGMSHDMMEHMHSGETK